MFERSIRNIDLVTQEFRLSTRSAPRKSARCIPIPTPSRIAPCNFAPENRAQWRSLPERSAFRNLADSNQPYRNDRLVDSSRSTNSHARSGSSPFSRNAEINSSGRSCVLIDRPGTERNRRKNPGSGRDRCSHPSPIHLSLNVIVAISDMTRANCPCLSCEFPGMTATAHTSSKGAREHPVITVATKPRGDLIE